MKKRKPTSKDLHRQNLENVRSYLEYNIKQFQARLAKINRGLRDGVPSGR